MIIPEHKAIFIHVSKTGGASIEHFFDPEVSLVDDERAAAVGNTDFKGKHAPAWKIRARVPDQFEEYFTFAFVRNPWARLVSNYIWWCYVTQNKGATFSDWLAARIGIHSYGFQYMLTDEKGLGDEVIVDFVGRFESLERDFSHIRGKLGINDRALPHKNKVGSQRPHYRAFYNRADEKKVAEAFRWECDRFGYEFEG